MYSTSHCGDRFSHIIEHTVGWSVTCDPTPNAGKIPSPETATLVKEFYMSEEISRIMPGMKDFVSVIQGGVRVHKQKHLVLCNLKEAFNMLLHTSNRRLSW